MFGQNKPVYLESRGSRRRRTIPRWLVLLLLGAASGIAGVIYLQERVLPPRLSASASTQLRSDFDKAESERLRLKADLDSTQSKLQAALAESKRFEAELGTSRQTTERLRTDLGSALAALPPDPRGGAVEVRTARFAAESGALSYDVVLSRKSSSDKPLTGVMHLIVAGAAGSGPETTLNLAPVAISLTTYQNPRGNLPLPAGFTPRQTTIRVLDKADGKVLGMRVFNMN